MKADCYLINGFQNRVYEVSAVENKLKKTLLNAEYLMFIFRRSGTSSGYDARRMIWKWKRLRR